MKKFMKNNDKVGRFDEKTKIISINMTVKTEKDI